MMQRDYRAGEVLFGEGEPSDYACRILSGEAEIVKQNEGDSVILGTAKAGEFIGEMGVIIASPRSATVRAVSALSVQVYPKDEFLKRISEDNQLAFRLLVRLSERLKDLSEAFVDAATIGDSRLDGRTPESDTISALPPLRIFASSDRLAEALPSDGVLVHSLPFVVGRAPVERELRPAVPVDLAIGDKRPYRLSRLHFSIVRDDSTYVVRDMHSMLGTSVNGQGLGDQFAADRASLHPGDNIVVAGGEGSPNEFRLVLEG
jgi:hypothetical protein